MTVRKAPLSFLMEETIENSISKYLYYLLRLTLEIPRAKMKLLVSSTLTSYRVGSTSYVVLACEFMIVFSKVFTIREENSPIKMAMSMIESMPPVIVL